MILNSEDPREGTALIDVIGADCRVEIKVIGHAWVETIHEGFSVALTAVEEAELCVGKFDRRRGAVEIKGHGINACARRTLSAHFECKSSRVSDLISLDREVVDRRWDAGPFVKTVLLVSDTGKPLTVALSVTSSPFGSTTVNVNGTGEGWKTPGSSGDPPG